MEMLCSHRSFLNNVKINLDYTEGRKYDYLQPSRGDRSLPSREEFNSVAGFTQTKTSTTIQLCKEGIRHPHPPTPEARKINLSLIKSK